MIDFLFIEFFVAVFIKWNQQFQNSLSYEIGQVPVAEVKFDSFCGSNCFGLLRIFQDYKWSFSLENISTFDRLVVFLEIELVSSVDVNSQESLDPVKVLIESDETVFVLINESENEQ